MEVTIMNLHNEHMVIQVFRLEKVLRFPLLDEFGVCGKKSKLLILHRILEPCGYSFPPNQIKT